MAFVFIETKLFTRLANEHLCDDDLSGLQRYLNENPDAGDLIRGSGAVRKLRWGASGRGKRGGLRIIWLRVSPAASSGRYKKEIDG